MSTVEDAWDAIKDQAQGGKQAPWPPKQAPAAAPIIYPTGTFTPAIPKPEPLIHPEGFFDGEVLSVTQTRDKAGIPFWDTEVRTEHGYMRLQLPSKFPKGRTVHIKIEHGDRGIHAKVARPQNSR